MPKYRIPEEFIPGFNTLTKISFDDLGFIISAIKESPVGSNSNDIFKSVKNKVELDSSELNILLQTIFSVIGVFVSESDGIEEVVEELIESYFFQRKDISRDTKDHMISSLNAILKNASNIKLTLKARALISEYEKIFVDSRILTDIRIVFGDSFDEITQSAVVVHQLKVTYQSQNELKQSFFALDINDLRQLKINIERALEKEARIQSGVYSPQLSFIDFNK